MQIQRINNAGAVPRYDIRPASVENSGTENLSGNSNAENTASSGLSLNQTVRRGDNAETVRNQKFNGEIECKTCSERQYVDGSDDPGVSFKTPTKMDPKEASVLVMAHEREHATRETAKAKAENKEVVSNTISLHTSICPECGKSYVSGGTTVTVTKSSPELDGIINRRLDPGVEIPFEDYTEGLNDSK